MSYAALTRRKRHAPGRRGRGEEAAVGRVPVRLDRVFRPRKGKREARVSVVNGLGGAVTPWVRASTVRWALDSEVEGRVLDTSATASWLRMCFPPRHRVHRAAGGAPSFHPDPSPGTVTRVFWGFPRARGSSCSSMCYYRTPSVVVDVARSSRSPVRSCCSLVRCARRTHFWNWATGS